MPARLQLFELKTKYNLLTTPNIDRYNLPYDSDGNLQYQILVQPALCDGSQVPLSIDRNIFTLYWPDYDYNEVDATGDGVSTTYSFTTQTINILRGHIDVIGQTAIANGQSIPVPSMDSAVYITTLDENNNQMVVTDSGLFLSTNNDVGLLTINSQTVNDTSNYGTINYLTGQVTVVFPSVVPQGNQIQIKYIQYEPGLPRSILLFNNIVQIRPVPYQTNLIVFDAYVTPANFLAGSQALAFGYMSEYIARGAARKILSDVGDIEQFNFYEPFFREQECLVSRRTDRQRSVNRTPTIFSQGMAQGAINNWAGVYGL